MTKVAENKDNSKKNKKIFFNFPATRGRKDKDFRTIEDLVKEGLRNTYLSAKAYSNFRLALIKDLENRIEAIEKKILPILLMIALLLPCSCKAVEYKAEKKALQEAKNWEKGGKKR
jgi:hypothetical protein